MTFCTENGKDRLTNITAPVAEKRYIGVYPPISAFFCEAVFQLTKYVIGTTRFRSTKSVEISCSGCEELLAKGPQTVIYPGSISTHKILKPVLAIINAPVQNCPAEVKIGQ